MKKIILVLSLLFPLFSNAADMTDDDYLYKDWNSVVKMLRSKGVVASKVKWAEIEAACAIVKDTSSAEEVNKCKYNKALDQNQYQNDTRYCNANAEQKYFEYIKPSKTSATFFNSDGDKITGVKEEVVQLNDVEINNFKNSAFVKCMREAGWNDPNSWAVGR